jgi:hypothetical protein
MNHHDPEIRLRQKYESNRPFEDSLFVEVDKVSCGGVDGHAMGVGEIDRPCQNGAGKTPPLKASGSPSEYQASPAGIQVSASSEGRQAGGVSLEAGICSCRHLRQQTQRR